MNPKSDTIDDIVGFKANKHNIQELYKILLCPEHKGLVYYAVDLGKEHYSIQKYTNYFNKV